tara:strand:- start:214 stop:702 length:489 start_codon:yes stop_codon:yes gene_type:complete
MPGVGKTNIGKLLSKKLNIKHIDIDQCVEINESQTINDLMIKRGEKAFRNLEKKELSLAIHSKELSIISTGGGAVLDRDNSCLIRDKTYGIHIKSSIEEIAKRIDVNIRPLLYNTNKLERLRSLWKVREKLYNNTAKIKINIKGLSLDAAVNKIYSRLLNDK